MSDLKLLVVRLQRLLTLLQRIPFRFSTIQIPSDFIKDEQGLAHMDSICMVLIAIGEEVKKIDRQTQGALFVRYPQIPWKEVMGMRDFLTHQYFQIDPEQLFNVCQQDIPKFTETVAMMLDDIQPTDKEA